VHPTVGSRRVFRQFAWLGVDSVKAALSRPAHQRVTPAVGWLSFKLKVFEEHSRMMGKITKENDEQFA